MARKVTGVRLRGSPTCCPVTGSRRFALGPDPDGEGELVATLVRRGEPAPPPARAVLAVHGYTDYFFNTELADHFAGRGFAFYALDLHKCGRSWREGQTPHFTTDLARYDAELDRALEVDRRGRPAAARIDVSYGHSAGGLIVTLWLDRLRRRGDRGMRISGLVLNSPFLDLHGPADPAHRAHVGGARSRWRGPQAAGVRRPTATAATAAPCTATTPANSTTT